MFAFVVIAVATLTPLPGRPANAAWCLWCDDLAGVDAISNVLLFIPFGVGLALAGVRLRWIAAIALATTVTVELLQLTVVSGRDASLRDVLTNLTGGVVGGLVARHLVTLARPDRRQALRLTVAWGAVWLAAHAALSWGEVVSFPESRYYGQRQPDLGQFDVFRGELLDASADGTTFPEGPDPALDSLRRLWTAARAIHVRAVVVPTARPTRRTAPIVSVFDEQERGIFVLGQRRDALVFTVHSRLQSAKLRPLVVGLPGVFPGSPRSLAMPGDTLTLTAEWREGRPRLTASTRRGTRSAEVRVGPALGWYATLPFDVPVVEWGAGMSLLWLLTTLAPLGYWGALAGRGAVVAAALGATVVLALGAAPSAAGIGVASVAEWCAAAAGLVLGWCAARVARHSAPRNAQIVGRE